MLVAIGYYITGRAGLLLSIPPGFATPVWPPSGIALAGILLLGYGVWPGVFFGSFFINLFIAFQAGQDVTLFINLFAAAGIALGASLQAVVGACLIKKFVKSLLLQTHKDVIYFLLLAGPIGCLICATIGVSLLTVLGFVSVQDAGFNWLTWWAGDSIGALVFAPLLTLLGQSRNMVDGRRKLMVLLPFFCFFMLTVVSFVSIKNMVHEKSYAEFKLQAQHHYAVIDDFIKENRALMNSLNGLYAVMGEPDFDKFTQFVTHSFQQHMVAQAVEWVPRIQAAQRAEFENNPFIKQYQDDGIIFYDEQGTHRAPNKDEYFPVHYIVPLQNNLPALGYDLSSDPVRRQTLEAARDKGKAQVTPPIKLVQEAGDQKSVLVVSPVYRGGDIPGLVENRRKQLYGYMVVVLCIGDLIENIFSQTGQTLDIYIYDAQASIGQAVMYGKPPNHDTMFTKEYDLPIEGHLWNIVFSQDELHQTNTAWGEWAVLIGGMFFTALLTAFLLQMTGRTALIAKSVDIKAEELERHNKLLLLRGQELDEMIHITTHDVQAPLRGILHQISIVSDDQGQTLTTGSTKRLERAETLAKHLQDLVNQLSQYARISRAPLQQSKIDLVPIIKEIKKVTSYSNEKRCRIDIKTDLPILMADRTRIGELFRNLITNGLKYNDSKTPTVEIGCTILPCESAEVFYIKDNGIGIQPEYKETVFAIFRRVADTEKYGEGSGSGLSFVKKIVERYNGRIWLESDKGKGTTFFFTLPDAIEKSSAFESNKDEPKPS